MGLSLNPYPEMRRVQHPAAIPFMKNESGGEVYSKDPWAGAR